MYVKELAVKKAILQNIAHERDKNVLMVYSSHWLFQSYIAENSVEWLDAMLVATGSKE